MFIDVYWKICTDTVFRKQIKKLGEEIAQLERAAMSDARASLLLQQKIQEFYIFCNNNPGLLVPHFFPDYPQKGKSMNLFSRPFSFNMFNFQAGGWTVIRASRQIGKALKESEPVLTPAGWSTIGDLKVGDTVIGSDGFPTKVTGVFPQGELPLFEVLFTDGSKSICCEDHLWTCKTSGSRRWGVKSLKEIRTLKGGDNPTSDQAIRIPLTQIAQMPSRDHIIHPYVLGALLGDGSIGYDNFGFSSDDLEIVERIEQLQEGLSLKLISKQHYSLCQKSTGAYHTKAPVKGEIERMGLRTTSEFKFIPAEYLYSDADSRIELLRGLMDTDGSIYGKCQMEFYSVSERLAKDVQFLVHSLGGTAEIKTKSAYYSNRIGTRVDCKECYRVKIRLWDTNPFWLDRKASKFYRIKYKQNRILERITPVGKGKAVCITVEAAHKNFLTRDCIVTHNSTSIAARQLMNAHILPSYRSLYVVPHEEHRKTYANRLREMERAFVYYSESSKHRQNLNYKEYPNGSIIELIRVLTTAAESRGKTTDELLFDEYQHFDASLEMEVEQTQKASFLPSKIYSGTSLTVDTPLETRWLQSSQGEWHIRARDGKHWINTGDKDDVLRIIQRNGPTCPYTGRILDVTDGCYIHRFPELLKTGRVGLHIPQVIIPDLVNKPIKWNQIWDVFNDYDQKSFLQEVLGIPTMEGAREITLEELKNICTVPHDYAQRKKLAQTRHYRHIVSGCDWGGSDYNPSDKTKVSFTVHVILGLAPDDKIDILHMRQYSGMNYREVAEDIIHNHREFNASAIASDFGVGAAYNMLLREQLPADRHFIFAYTGPRTAPLSAPAGFGWFNQYSLNRTESITQLYSAIKQESPRIRCYNWEESSALLLDFMNLYRVPTENSSGTAEFKYRRHGSKPDDTLHAVNFAYTLMRLLLGEPMLEDRGLLTRVLQQLHGKGTFGPPLGGNPRVVVG